MSLKILLLILLAEILGSAMHIFFKKSVNSLSLHGSKRFSHDTDFFKDIFRTSWIWAGICSVMLGLFLWLIVLAQIDLSVAYAFDSLQYIIILLASIFLFREYVNGRRILGSGLIIAGIWLVACYGK